MWEHMGEGGVAGWFAAAVMLLVVVGAIAIIVVKGKNPEDDE